MKLRFSLAGESRDKLATVTVSGKVFDKATKQPIPNTSVRGNLVIWGRNGPGPGFFDRCPYQETVANQAGEYRLKFVTPLTTSGPMQGQDDLCVYAGASGYETRPIFADKSMARGRLDYRIDFALDKGKVIRGVVVDADHRPVADARVRIQNSASGVWTYFDALGRTTTDKDGKFQICCTTQRDLILIDGNPWLQVFKPGYGAGFYFDILKKDDMGTLVLPKGGEIRGRVIDSAGKGVGNCEVYATTWFIEPIVIVRTDAEGRYVLSGIPGEPSIVSFYKNKNRSYQRPWGETEVFARTDPALSLSDVPRCRIMAQEGKTVAAPDLVTGDSHSVSGRLVPSKSTLVGLKGLLVSLDDAVEMREADADGRFYLPFVLPGKHRLFVYLPTTGPNGWGIGRTQIDVPAGKKLEGVEIPLDVLAEARVQFLDANGNPLEGILTGASFSRDYVARHDGPGMKTLGTRSNADGWAVIYLYIFPFGPQYLYGFDVGNHKLVSSGVLEVNPKPGEVLNNLRITMVPAASIKGRVLDAKNAPVPRKVFECMIDYADKLREKTNVWTDATGRFEVVDLKPGVVRLWLASLPAGEVASVPRLTEIKPGETTDLGDLRLAAGKAPPPAGKKCYQVKGKVTASPTFSDLRGFKTRLGWMEWEPMVATDAQGGFTLEQVPPGRHRLTAYLPFNLRGDRGVGRVEIEVKDDNLEGVELPLETLATVEMRIEDPQGQPLEGVSAAAWWTPDHSGMWTEGSRSGKQGRATLYLYSDGQEQYVGAVDLSGRYVLKSDWKKTPKRGEVVKDLIVIMQPAAQ